MTTVNSRIGSPCACLNRRRTNCRWRSNYRFDARLALALIGEEQIVANSYSSINFGASVCCRRSCRCLAGGGCLLFLCHCCSNGWSRGDLAQLLPWRRWQFALSLPLLQFAAPPVLDANATAGSARSFALCQACSFLYWCRSFLTRRLYSALLCLYSSAAFSLLLFLFLVRGCVILARQLIPGGTAGNSTTNPLCR